MGLFLPVSRKACAVIRGVLSRDGVGRKACRKGNLTEREEDRSLHGRLHIIRLRSVSSKALVTRGLTSEELRSQIQPKKQQDNAVCQIAKTISSNGGSSPIRTPWDLWWHFDEITVSPSIELKYTKLSQRAEIFYHCLRNSLNAG
jgi:hypothetical protein